MFFVATIGLVLVFLFAGGAGRAELRELFEKKGAGGEAAEEGS